MSKEIQVLFLDDEESILDGLQRLFIKEPYGILTTSSADQAREIISNERIKVMVSDQRMPEIQGVKFLREVKDQHPDIIRILFTGYTDFSSAEEAINIGEVYRFISKPWKTAELISTIRQSIEHYDLLTKAKAHEEELESANKKLKAMYEVQKEFTAVISHELRTPLTVIKESVAIVSDEMAGPINADQKDFLDTAKRNVDRLAVLISDALDYQKLEDQRMEFSMAENDINAAVKEAGDRFGLPLKNKGLLLEYQLQSGLPKLSFDKERIAQVLTNLINNAIKFTDQGNIVLVTEKIGDDAVQVSVKDQGIGIREGDLQKLFQGFSQISSGLGRQTGGTGLGLALCKKIIERHKGKVGVRSVFGKGSTFYFTLPVREGGLIKGLEI
jgi:signal transduction histidine kinase